MLDKPKSSVAVAYDYVTSKIPGYTFTTDELWDLPFMTRNRAAGALCCLEKKGVVKAVGKARRGMFVWEFVEKVHDLHFGKGIVNRKNNGNRCNIGGGRRNLEKWQGGLFPVLHQIPINCLDMSPAQFVERKVVKKLSERLLEMAIELEAKGL